MIKKDKISSHNPIKNMALSFQIGESTVATDEMADFVRRKDLARAEITAIPGVDETDPTADALSDHGINTMLVFFFYQRTNVCISMYSHFISP